MNPFNSRIVLLITLSISIMCGHDSFASEALSIEEAVQQLDATISQAGSTNPEAVQEAAALLSFALESNEIETAEGHLALANAYFIGEDLGRAITHYRKGLAIDPHHEVLQANLAHARSFVEPTLPSDGESMTLGSVLQSWQHVMSTQTLWYISIGLAVFASLSFTAMALSNRKRIPKALPIASVSLALLGVFLVGFSEYQSASHHSAVVSAAGTRMYSGPGTGVYQEVYEGPLGIGTEAQVLSIDGSWAKIQLGNNQEGWIDASSLLYVHDAMTAEDPNASS